MKRPHLVHFLSIMTEESLHIKASITMKSSLVTNKRPNRLAREIEKDLPSSSFPIQAFRLLGSNDFKIKLVGLDLNQNEIYKKAFDSDSFGNLNFKVPLHGLPKKIAAIQIYEIGKRPGLEIHLGTFIPLKIDNPKKIIICDFDKTLVDTKYSTTKEVYRSLTKPLNHFPTVTNSLELIQGYLKKGHHPFILSASPHFYEDAMRDWLYQNQIFTAGIFLKDYRQVFSIFEGDLTPKDLKIQGMYKFNHLLDILLMTGAPDELVLVGDNFESDPIIYLSLAKLLVEKEDPWKLWNTLKGIDAFQMTQKQDSKMLNKFYQLSNIINSKKDPIEVKIYIRKKVDEDSISLPPIFEQTKNLIELYEGIS